MSFYANALQCTSSLTCNLDANGNKLPVTGGKEWNPSVVLIKTFPLCPKPGIYRSRMKLSESIDQDIKLWWLSHEGSMWPFRGGLNTENGLICLPPKKSSMTPQSSPSSSADWFTFIKRPVGNFSQGWWWLSWVHQIADQTNYANICSAPASYILTWKHSAFFYFRRGEFASKIFSFLMSGKCKPWQNLISRAIKGSRKWRQDMLPFYFLKHCLDQSKLKWRACAGKCLVFQLWGYRSVSQTHISIHAEFSI